MKTTADIEQDIYNVAKEYLAGKINGSVYKSCMRPKDSTSEDAVVVISYASAGQIQESSVYINIFVSDIANGRGGLVPNKARLKAIASLDEGLTDAVNSAYTDYNAELSGATDILEEQNAGQHIVSINLLLTINII